MTTRPMTEAEFLTRVQHGVRYEDGLAADALAEFFRSHGMHEMARVVPDYLRASTERAWDGFMELGMPDPHANAKLVWPIKKGGPQSGPPSPKL